MDDKYKSLVEKNNLYKKILNSLPNFFAYKNIDGVYELVSEEADKLYKGKFSTIAGKSIDEIYTKEAAADVRELDKEVIDKGEPINTIFDAETVDGIITIDSTRIPIYDDLKVYVQSFNAIYYEDCVALDTDAIASKVSGSWQVNLERSNIIVGDLGFANDDDWEWTTTVIPSAGSRSDVADDAN